MNGSYEPDSYWQGRGGSSYREYVESPGYTIYRQEQDRFFSELIQCVQPERMLDFACGTGKLFPIWKDVAEVHGYDRAVSQIDEARKEAENIPRERPYQLLHGRSESRTVLPYEDDYFDLVVAPEVLLHVLPKDVAALIAELHRVCRGTVAIVTAAPFDNPASHCFDHDYKQLLSRGFTITDDHAVHRQRYIVAEKRAITPVPIADRDTPQRSRVMPSSRPELIPFVLKFVMDLKPKSILEIGAGFGKYGFLFREYLDIWAAAADPTRLNPANWQVQIDGIEIFEAYIGELQRKIYNRIIIGDAMTEIDKLDSYDLIFLGDVIEHFPKEEGQRLLNKCLDHCNSMVMVTTPNYFNPQGAEYGNERETHHCLWTADDFGRFPGAQSFLVEDRYNLALIPARQAVSTPPPAQAHQGESAATGAPSFSFDS